jgi:hypothetical protein
VCKEFALDRKLLGTTLEETAIEGRIVSNQLAM